MDLGWGGIVGSGEGRIGGVAVAGGGLLGCRFGADVVWMSAPGSFWGLDGTEVLCFRRWEEVRGRIDDRTMSFPCIA